MTQLQKTLTFWVIFLIIIAIITLLVFPQYGYVARTIRFSLGRNVANILTAATAANYRLRKADATKGTPILNCQDIVHIQGNKLPKEFYIANQEMPTDKVVFCTLIGKGIQPIQFSAIGIK